jgi:hypothetical protein
MWEDIAIPTFMTNLAAIVKEAKAAIQLHHHIAR